MAEIDGLSCISTHDTDFRIKIMKKGTSNMRMGWLGNMNQNGYSNAAKKEAARNTKIIKK